MDKIKETTKTIKTRKLVVPLEYDNASKFFGGVAWARKGDYFTGKSDFVDKTGVAVGTVIVVGAAVAVLALKKKK